MNYCDTCIHREVCGEEDAREPAITYCAYRIEPCEDVISRQAVLNTLDRMDEALDENRTIEEYKNLLIECYRVLPSVQLNCQTGH